MVAGLYAALLLALTVPAILLAFAPGIGLGEAVKAFKWWPYWLWLAVMLASQLALLAVPVRVASLRPVTRGPVWRTIAAGGFMAGGLAAAAFFSIYEFVVHGLGEGEGALWTALEIGLLGWCVWALIFSRLSRRVAAPDLVSCQCRWLLRGSILELLIAVPTHVVARYRDYCCAGFMTFIGLTMGVSVMLFAYGPAVFFLFAERWKQLHPAEK
ncbi:MAG TPA: hypothetical protein VF988_03555 [Verrucomicrobiae bacterium]